MKRPQIYIAKNAHNNLYNDESNNNFKRKNTSVHQILKHEQLKILDCTASSLVTIS